MQGLDEREREEREIYGELSERARVARKQMWKILAATDSVAPAHFTCFCPSFTCPSLSSTAASPAAPMDSGDRQRLSLA
jgi:hypothetical protein